MIATTRPELSVNETPLFVAVELSQREWKLAMTSGFRVRPWLRTIAAGDLPRGGRGGGGAGRFQLAASVPIVSCYEAGRDGFWIHRALTQRGVDNRVVDSASIAVSRRAKSAKTDRLDAEKLVAMLVRVWHGEQHVWREVRVPTAAVEAARQVSRERTALTQEQTALRNQMRSWLVTWGAPLPAQRPDGWWTAVRDWAGAALPAELQARLARATARLTLLARANGRTRGVQRAAVAAAAATSAVRHW